MLIDPLEMELEAPEVYPTCAFCDEDAAGKCELCEQYFCLNHGSVAERCCYWGTNKEVT